MIMSIIVKVVLTIIVMILCDWHVSVKALKVSHEPQSPVLHLYLESSSGSRDQDIALLRKIVSLVSFVW